MCNTSATLSWGGWGAEHVADSTNQPQSPLPSARVPHVALAPAGAMVCCNACPCMLLGATVGRLQRHCEKTWRSTERRFKDVERQLQACAVSLSGHTQHRGLQEKWVEVQGSLGSIFEETQVLARRMDGLDQRMVSCASGAEGLAQHGLSEVRKQLVTLERQVKLSSAAAESAAAAAAASVAGIMLAADADAAALCDGTPESQRRLALKQKRTDSLLENLQRRLAKVEEEFQKVALAEFQQPWMLPGHFQGLCEVLEAVEVRVGELEMAAPQVAASTSLLEVEDEALETTELRGALDSAERRLGTLEGKAAGQLDELTGSLALVRVKVDGLLQRQDAFAERLEAAHVPAIEALRVEVAEQRQRDLHNIEDWIAAVWQHVRAAGDSADEGSPVERGVKGCTAAWVTTVEATMARMDREIRDLWVVAQAPKGHSSTRGHSNRRSALGSSSPGSSFTAVPENTTVLIQKQLTAVADQLEVLDDVIFRVTELEHWTSVVGNKVDRTC